jgi:hypothetical protein
MLRRIALVAVIALAFIGGTYTSTGCGFGSGAYSPPPPRVVETTLGGGVYDALTDKLVEGASIRVAQSDWSRSVFSDHDGMYAVIGARPGTVEIAVAAPGYVRMVRTVRLTAGENRLNIALQPLP